MRAPARPLACAWLLLAACLALAALLPTAAPWPPAAAQVRQDPTPPTFVDAAEEARFRALVGRLRCVMCQNQSLADSDAMIAHDLRREILRRMRKGETDAQIEAFLVERYSEFVLYRPRVEPRNWLLWFGPGLLLLGGAVVVWRIVRRQRAAPANDGVAGDAPPASPVDDKEEW
jgi:cytochrome c-type biogenesis protein CcmH